MQLLNGYNEQEFLEIVNMQPKHVASQTFIQPMWALKLRNNPRRQEQGKRTILEHKALSNISATMIK